jgi:hypothetical protein
MNSNIFKMKKTLRFAFLTLAFWTGAILLSAQTQYSNFKNMSQKIEALTKEFPAVCSSRSLIKTAGGKDIWVITIGTGDKDNKPGIAIVGGVEGSHILGKELATGFAASLLKESSTADIKALLDKVTFYILPDVSPDATEQFFSEVKYERNINSRSTDDDKDFTSDEDPYEDLNKDGYISLIRVIDPAGKFIENPEDKRVMAEADLSKGQTGKFLVFSEGIDNDKDEKFNEDGPGGVSFNRNFTYNYEEFGINAGLYPVSEPEVKAVADFLYDKFNIYAVFTFGPQDNLGQPMKSSDRPNPDRRITSIMKSDEVINRLVSDKYHEITGAKGAPVTKTTPGNFMEWAYFHYGRYSFSTPAWWFTPEKDKNPEAQFLKFAEKNKIKDVFVPWTEFNHPDFPGKKTEIGGIKPFAMINPPADTLDALISKNYKFIVAVAAMHPEIEFLDIKTENTGENIFRVTLKVHNKGVFATCAEVGDINTWTRVMRITFEPGNNINMLSGMKVQRIGRLQGNQSVEYSWLVNGKGSVKVIAGALNAGTVTTTIDLK